MSALTVFNQTVTDMLTPRKSAPPATADRPEFDRQLKDAGERFNKAEPPADKAPVAKVSDEHAAADPVTTTTDHDTQAESKDSSQDTPSDEGQATDTADSSQGDPADESTSDVEVQAESGQEPTVATTADPGNKLLLQQTVVQVSEADTVQTTEGKQSENTSQTQAVSGQIEQNAAVNATADQQVNELSTNAVTGPVQPQLDKAAQSITADNTNQNQSSASAQRLAVVTEARQSDTQQSGSGETSQQDQGTLNSDTRSLQASTTQRAGPAVSVTAGAGDAASTPTATFTASDNQVTQTSGASQVAPTAQTRETDNTQLNTARIARGLQNAVQQKGGTVTLRLTPPEMGTVRIQLQMQSGTVNAQFHAETESTRSLLNQQMSQLRSSLEQQGLTVERLGVQTLQQSSAGSSLDNESQGRDGQQQDGRSRGGFSRQGGQQDPSAPDEPSGFDQELNQAA
jgi:flagellar hook-length control protein FliK